MPTPAPNPWRRFVRSFAAAGLGALAAVYLFIVIVDPFDTLPLSPPFDRPPVATNARYSFPALARSARFDSAVFGTSTSRLLRPAALNPEFSARFANLAMNSATPYEQSRLLEVFARAHPQARNVAIGLDQNWCVTGAQTEKYTPRAFPEWMYQPSLWHAYREMLNLYTIEAAGQQFAVLAGIKPPRYGRDGYTTFVPPESQYNLERALRHLRAAGITAPPGERDGSPADWRFPELDTLRHSLALLAPRTRKILFFVPFNHRMLPPEGHPARAVWDACKARVTALATAFPNTVVADFMIPSPITRQDDHYWDPLHYREPIADRIAAGLALAVRGGHSEDFTLLWPPRR